MYAYLVGFFGAQPHRSGLFATDHEVDVVLCAQAVRHCRQEAVRVGRQVYARGRRLQVEDRADERRVLMREPVMLPIPMVVSPAPQVIKLHILTVSFNPDLRFFHLLEQLCVSNYASSVPYFAAGFIQTRNNAHDCPFRNIRQLGDLLERLYITRVLSASPPYD